MNALDAPNLNEATDPAGWVDLHGDALYRFAMLRLRDPEQAEDVVQECFAAALVARERFAGQSSERTWLVGILKRKVIDQLRKRTRERGVEELEEADGEPGDFFTKRGKWSRNPRKWAGDPGALAQNREFWGAFRRCLEGLTPNLAAIFVLRELDDMKSEEICRVHGISTTNLWARLHRARLGLRQCLESTWFAGPR